MLALVVSGGHTHLYLCTQVSEARPGAPDSDPTHDDETVMDGVPGSWRYRNVGRTVDDAAGEAFDKVAKLLGLGYPGGPWMDALARSGNPRAVEFHFGQIKARRVGAGAEEKQIPPLRCGMTNKKTGGMTNKECCGMTNKECGGMTNKTDGPTVEPTSQSRDVGYPDLGPTYDFSFSGIKTAVLRYIQGHGMAAGVEARRRALAEALKANPALRPADALREMPEVFDRQTLDLIASFQFAVVGNLMRQTFAAAVEFGVRGIVVSGGVSANSELRRRFAEEAAQRGLPVAFPTMAMSTDNAAMIAAAAWGKFRAGEFAAEGLVATPQLGLGSRY